VRAAVQWEFCLGKSAPSATGQLTFNHWVVPGRGRPGKEPRQNVTFRSTPCKGRPRGGAETVKNYIRISCQSYSLPKRRLRPMSRERGVPPPRGRTMIGLAGSEAWEEGARLIEAPEALRGAQERFRVFLGRRPLNHLRPPQGQKNGAVEGSRDPLMRRPWPRPCVRPRCRT